MRLEVLKEISFIFQRIRGIDADEGIMDSCVGAALLMNYVKKVSYGLVLSQVRDEVPGGLCGEYT